MSARTPHVAPTHGWFVALGSNIGDARETFSSVYRVLRDDHDVCGVSPIYLTPPMYDEDQALFHNAVLLVSSRLSAPDFLAYLQGVERSNGRVRHPERRYGPRTLDLDIVAAIDGDSEGAYTTPSLTIPHPRMHERRFVLQPLVDLAPDWHHPHLGVSAKDLLNNLPKDASMRLVYQPKEWT